MKQRRVLALCAILGACTRQEGTGEVNPRPAGSGGDTAGAAGAAGAGGSRAGASGNGGNPAGNGGTAGSGGTASVAGAAGAGGSDAAPFEGKWTRIELDGCDLWHTADAATLANYPMPGWEPCPDTPNDIPCEMLEPHTDKTSSYDLAFSYSQALGLFQIGMLDDDWQRKVVMSPTGELRELIMDSDDDRCYVHAAGLTESRSVWSVWMGTSDSQSAAAVEARPDGVTVVATVDAFSETFTVVKDGIWQEMRQFWNWDGTPGETLDLPNRVVGEEFSDGNMVVWSEFVGEFKDWIYSWTPEDGVTLLDYREMPMKAGYPSIDDGTPVWSYAEVEDTYAARGIATLTNGAGVENAMGYIGWLPTGGYAGCGRVLWNAQGEIARSTFRVTEIATGKSYALPSPSGHAWKWQVPIASTCDYFYGWATHNGHGRVVRFPQPKFE